MNTIEPVSKRSLSDHAREHLKTYIHSLNAASSRKLPAEKDLALQLGVSRITIRRALNELEQEGLILRIHGKGTFINPEALQIKVNLCSMMEFGSVIKKSGYQSHMAVTGFSDHITDPAVCAALRLPSDSLLIRIEKMYRADEHPAIISISYIPHSLFEQLPEKEEWVETPYFTLLSRYTRKNVTRDRVELEAVSTAKMQTFLTGSQQLENDSLLLLKACCFDQNNEPVMYGMAFYDTNYIRFNLIRNEALS